MKPLTDIIYEYLDEHPRATLEELHQVFSNYPKDKVSIAVAELYRKNKIVSETTYRIA